MFLFLLPLATGFVFEDVDCLFRPPTDSMTNHNLTWANLLQTLLNNPNRPTNEELSLYTTSDSQCPIGSLTACLLLQLRGGACEPFTQAFPHIHHVLLSRWPLLGFLQTLNRIETSRRGFVDPCDSLFHPSIDWREYRLELDRGVTLWGPAMDGALKTAFAVAWKASSAAVYTPTGVTVGEYAKKCPLGIVATNVLRALGFVLSPPHSGDTMKIVEMLLHDTNKIFASFDTIAAVLTSSWPVLQSLHVIHNVAKDRMKRGSLIVDPNHFEIGQAARTDEGDVILVLVTEKNGHMVDHVIAKYEKFMLPINIITESHKIYAQCKQNESLYAVCLPVIVENPLITKYLYLYRLIEDNSGIFFHTAEFVPMHKSFLNEAKRITGYLDFALLPDLYSRLYSERVMFFKRTHMTYTFLNVLLEYALHAPFPDERAALHFVLDKDAKLGLVPGVSYLSRTTPEVRQVALCEIFATSEGFVPKKTSQLLGIDFDCNFPEDEVCVTDHLTLLRGENEAEIATVIAKKAHGNFAKSSQRFESTDEPIGRNPEIFNRAEILKNKRCVCEEPSLPPVDSSDVSSAYMYHVNFANNCCERDQKLSSASALRFFANESRPLNGTILDEEFLEKNDELLKFDRTNLVAGKTPSNLRGYYVWKPYGILKGVCDLPYGSIVVYTDAGVMTSGPLRPLLSKYLSVSDVTAVQTEMYEQARSKRDAFLVLDADFMSVATTQQIASGIIAFRKTPNTMNFFEWWLAALESKYVITEEPSLMGREYDGYINSNDDQTGFSLLFKKFGYTPFSYVERNEVIDIARNLAKFVNASDAYALGINATSSGYLKAADARAEEQLKQAA